MNDTPEHILQKQFEIVMAIPLRKRLENLFELTELSRSIIRNQLNIKHPDWSEIDIHIELFRIFYRDDFEKEELEKIANEMREYLESKRK